jgi:putative folate metabolism gamma-glutamate ligase
MKVEAIKTRIIVENDNIYQVLDEYLPILVEGDIVAVTSKIISLCEGRTANVADKKRLVREEADCYLPENELDIVLTIKNNILIPNSGIDESNAAGKLILWPKDSWRSAERIRKYLAEKFGLTKVGVIITDSKTTPLRFGTTGIALACSGFDPIKDYIGSKDIFGRKLEVTKANIADGLASTAVLAMGEGKEMTPIARISDVSFVTFCHNISKTKMVEKLTIDQRDDLYGLLLNKAGWEQ